MARAKITGGTLKARGKGYNRKVGNISFGGKNSGNKLSFDVNSSTIFTGGGANDNKIVVNGNNTTISGGKGSDTIQFKSTA